MKCPLWLPNPVKIAFMNVGKEELKSIICDFELKSLEKQRYDSENNKI